MKLDEIKTGKDIGYKSNKSHIWLACLDCGKERWVELRRGLPRSLKCQGCSQRGKHHSPKTEFKKGHKGNCGLSHPNWKGGLNHHNGGYIKIWCSEDGFFAPMRNGKGYILEHRLVVAKALGRCLHRWELVHHKHTKYPAGSIEDKQDNRYPENLQLVSDDRHKQITIMEQRIKQLEQRVTLLEAENILLKASLAVES